MCGPKTGDHRRRWLALVVVSHLAMLCHQCSRFIFLAAYRLSIGNRCGYPKKMCMSAHVGDAIENVGSVGGFRGSIIGIVA